MNYSSMRFNIFYFLTVWMVIPMTEQRVVTHHSVRLAREMRLSARSVLLMPPMKYNSSPTRSGWVGVSTNLGF